MNKIISIICIFSLFSCNSNQSISMNQPKRDILEIEKEVRKGNIASYQEIRIIYLDYPSEKFLFWSMLMANKYDYPEAYLDVFYTIINSYGLEIGEFKEMDKRTQEFALDYLTIASRKGVKGAENILLTIQSQK